MATLRQQIATNVLTVTRFRDLMKTLRANRPNDDLGIVEKAYEFSQKNHAGQTRASGDPYLVHPLEVACVLAEMKMDRSEEHTSELQSQFHLVCRLLLEKKK